MTAVYSLPCRRPSTDRRRRQSGSTGARDLGRVARGALTDFLCLAERDVDALRHLLERLVGSRDLDEFVVLGEIPTAALRPAILLAHPTAALRPAIRHLKPWCLTGVARVFEQAVENFLQPLEAFGRSVERQTE